jgi:hypothetical protein
MSDLCKTYEDAVREIVREEISRFIESACDMIDSGRMVSVEGYKDWLINHQSTDSAGSQE